MLCCSIREVNNFQSNLNLFKLAGGVYAQLQCVFFSSLLSNETKKAPELCFSWRKNRRNHIQSNILCWLFLQQKIQKNANIFFLDQLYKADLTCCICCNLIFNLLFFQMNYHYYYTYL